MYCSTCNFWALRICWCSSVRPSTNPPLHPKATAITTPSDCRANQQLQQGHLRGRLRDENHQDAVLLRCYLLSGETRRGAQHPYGHLLAEEDGNQSRIWPSPSSSMTIASSSTLWNASASEGITIPIIPGIKPLKKLSQINMIPKAFKVDLPEELAKEVLKCKSDKEVQRGGHRMVRAAMQGLIAKGVPSRLLFRKVLRTA